jgi:hypothetical protein
MSFQLRYSISYSVLYEKEQKYMLKKLQICCQTSKNLHYTILVLNGCDVKRLTVTWQHCDKF